MKLYNKSDIKNLEIINKNTKLFIDFSILVRDYAVKSNNIYLLKLVDELSNKIERLN